MLVKNLITLLHINFSKTFKKQERIDIGGWFEYDFLSFDLEINVTTATLSSLGIMPVSNVWLYIYMCLRFDYVFGNSFYNFWRYSS